MAGKGDMPRPCNLEKYRRGYDKIDWSVGKLPVKSSKDDSMVIPLKGDDYFCGIDLAKGSSQTAVMMVPAKLLGIN